MLALMHEDLVPPTGGIEELSYDQVAPWKMEYDVVSTLEELGHRVRTQGVRDELAPIREAVRDFRPHVVFNLIEEFAGLAVWDQNVVAYLELLRAAYTGCNPRGLVLARDKALSKKILAYHRLPVPDFAVFAIGRRVRRPRRLAYPLIVKSLVEESSTGISRASVVTDDEKLAERVRLVHERVGTDAIAEQYIEGRELYVGVLGNHRLQVLPTWELFFPEGFGGGALVATERVKHDRTYQEKHGIDAGRARDLPGDLERRLARASRRIYRLLGLSGYARLDFRLGADGRFYFLEANPNPDISCDEEFAASWEATDRSYGQLIEHILSLGMRRAGSQARGDGSSEST